MRPLLEITTTYAQYEYEITNARLEISQDNPTTDRSTSRAELNMRHQAGRLEMNTVRRRSDMGFKGVVDRATFEGEEGKEAALKATRDYVEIGNQMAKFYEGVSIPDALWSKSIAHNKGELVLVPVSPVDIHYIPANLAMDYKAGEMQTDWNIGRARLDFTPGSFGLNFTQYASIDIEYVGGFMYVPPSADPNFEAQA